MKKMFVVLVAVIIFCSSVIVAVAGEKEKILTGYVYTGIFSKYVCDGSVIFHHPVVQPAIGITFESLGLYAEVWGSYSPRSGWDSDAGDEIDYTIGWAPEFRGFKLDVGYSFLNFVSLKNITGDLHDFYMNIAAPAVYGITPSVNFGFNLPQDKDMLEGGVIYSLNLEAEQGVAGQPIAIKITAVGHDGAFNAEPETVSSLNLRLATKFTVLENMEIIPELNFQKRVGKKVNDGGLSNDLVWYGVKINYPFDIIL